MEIYLPLVITVLVELVGIAVWIALWATHGNAFARIPWRKKNTKKKPITMPPNNFPADSAHVRMTSSAKQFCNAFTGAGISMEEMAKSVEAFRRACGSREPAPKQTSLLEWWNRKNIERASLLLKQSNSGMALEEDTVQFLYNTAVKEALKNNTDWKVELLSVFESYNRLKKVRKIRLR